MNAPALSGQHYAGSSAEGEFAHAVKRFSGARERSVPLRGMKAMERISQASALNFSSPISGAIFLERITSPSDP